MFGILPTRVHGFLDYVIGLSLVIMPFILERGAGPQTWLPVVLGGGMIVYSLLTEYEMGVVPLIGMPYPPHPGRARGDVDGRLALAVRVRLHRLGSARGPGPRRDGDRPS